MPQILHRTIPSPDQFQEMVNAFRISRIILTAAELNIFDDLADAEKTSEEVAISIGTSARATNRLLNALVSIGLLQKANTTFSNTPFADTFLVTTSPSYMSGLALTNHTWRTWSTLTEAVKEGTSVHFEDPINDRPEAWRESFIAAMHRRAGPQAVEVADALDLTKVKRVLDIGGGSGAFTLEFLSRNPKMTGVVFDLPNIVPITERYLTAPPPALPQQGRGDTHLTPSPSPGGDHLAPSPSPQGEGSIRHQASGIRDRISVKAGDYLTDHFGSGFDLVFMSAIIHINSAEENQWLIKKGAEALNPGGQLVIVDHIMSEDRTEPRIGAIFAINMLVGTKHGDTYTEHELCSWMEESGLKDIAVITTPSGVQLIRGTRDYKREA